MEAHFQTRTDLDAMASDFVDLSDSSSLSQPGPSGTITGRRRESFVWDYFIFDPTKGKSICQVEVQSDTSVVKCCAEITGKFPTNLKAHLKGSHSKAYEDVITRDADRQKEKTTAVKKPYSVDSGQKTLSSCMQKAKPYDKHSPRFKKITRKLATFVAGGNVANRIVECVEFRELLSELDPRYPVPNRSVIDTEMEALYTEMKGKVASKLQEARKIAICTDIWSRKGLTQSFLGITAHFFTRSDHKRHNATLAVRLLPSPHTADRIEEMVRTILQEWSISEQKISTIVTDNGSNMVAAFKNWLHIADEQDSETEDEDKTSQPPVLSCEESSDESITSNPNQESGLEYGTTEVSAIMKEVKDFEDQELEYDVAFCGQKRIGCFAHSLQLVVRRFDTIQSSKRALNSAHRKFCKSVKANERLIKRCGLKLIGDCPTRWNSTYLMISRLLDLRTHVEEVLHELEWDSLPNSEWKIVENYRDLLEPFFKYTGLTGAEENTTLAMVVPVVMELTYHLNECKEKAGIRQIANVLHQELVMRFEKVLQPGSPSFCPIYVEATLLDPRYRIILSEEQVQVAKVQILKDCDHGTEVAPPSYLQTPTEDDEPSLKRFKHLSNIVLEKQKAQATALISQSTHPCSPQIKQLKTYLEDKFCKWDESLDALDFWVQNEEKYPDLAPVAFDLLTIPATSTPIERVFSTAGFVSTGRRNKLSARRLEREVLIKKNKHFI